MMDPYQPFRMAILWPIFVGCVAFYAVTFIASTLDGRLTRWQAGLAGVAGVMASVVTRSIARAWDGTPLYWLAFTLGLTFAVTVLLVNAVAMILGAERRP